MEVRSPAAGSVKWHKADGAEVRPDEEYLGVVEWIDDDGNKKIEGIRNPIFGEGVKGVLIIFPRRYPLVDIRDFLADIKITGLLYAGKVSGSSRA
ncbi:MAG: hypothetical protein GY800_04450 [Planctomycetes bacterium]|nr:hypothetical protein [Planctomycetota bacterium]